ncbi:MAG TPA: hypothetical protein VES89_02840 [Candidatus Competibacteraceae bacterium]|nr:hypothetical protein [Candidatus Competibacteraceae bacterium]
MIDPLIEHFSELNDPRYLGKIEPRLMDILVIAVYVILACTGTGRIFPQWLQ